MITVQLLGGASLRDGDAILSGPPAQRHRIALLTLVVATWPQPLSRDRAMALLWPERDTAGARRLLNLAVHVLRSALGEGAIASTVDGLLLDPACVSCDVHDIRAAIGANDVERVVQLYAGPLLDGFHLDDSIEFGYWLDDRRNELAHAYIGALLTQADQQERSSDVHGRVGTCRRLVAADPHSALHAQRLMRALAAAGDVAGAGQHAIEHAQRVRTDLDIEPDPDVTALAEQLRAAVSRRPSTPAGATHARSTSVAVLPFRNISADSENEYFADGVTEDVIAQLSKIRAIKVISSASVMRFKDRQHTLQQIGAALGVSTLLDGSVRRAGDRVRIVAQLVDVQADRPLWTETFDRQLADIFAIQTEVALRIAAALETELTADERMRVRREPTRDMMAYQLFLQGRQWLIRFTGESLRRAIEYFDRAIARDPSYALAYSTKAMAYIELGELGEMAPGVAYPGAMDAATNALRLDPELGAAHCMMGCLKAVWEHAWSDAEQEFKRALELSPGTADTYDLYGRLCAGLGRYDEAIAMLEHAQELDPLAHRVDIATALIRAGRLDEAVVRAEHAVEIDAGDRARATLGWAYFLSGRQREGVVELERAASASPDSTMWLAQLGEAHGLAGDMVKARVILRTLEERALASYVSPYHLAYVHTGLGNVEQAIDWLERAAAERAGPLYGIKGSFLFAPLQSHPRFRALLQEMRLDEHGYGG